MRNRVFSLLLAVGLITGMAVPAYATDHSSSKEHSVTFDGTQMINKGIDSNSIADAFEGESIQPGDTLTMRVDIQNKYNGNTDWYMSNKVVKSFEDTGAAGGGTNSGAYTYTLTYYPASGSSQLLYNSHDVGGDVQDYTKTRGLGEATEGLKDFFKLDTLGYQDKGYLTLTVHLDGETQGNSYQDTLAKLKMQFAVELSDQETSTTPSTPSTPSTQTTPSTPTTPSTSTNTTTPTPTTNTTTTGRNAVRTGDEFNLVPYLIAAVVSGLLLIVVGIFLAKKKTEKNEKGGGAR